MVNEFRFVNGLDPTEPEDRAVAYSERRSHAAKHGHQLRRKAVSRQKPKNARPLLMLPPQQSRQDDDRFEAKIIKRLEAISGPSFDSGSAACSPNNLPHVAFSDNVFDRRSFAFWQARTKRFTSRDGSKDDVFEWIIPQYAWSSPSVHHMLIAHSMFHELTTKPRELQDTIVKARAVRHYVEGLRHMRGPKTTLIENLLSSYMAWIVEGLQYQDESAAVHVRGWKILLQYANENQHTQFSAVSASEGDIIRHKISPMLERAEGIYTLSMECMKPLPRVEACYGQYLAMPCKMAVFSTSEEARREIVRIILCIHEAMVKENVQAVVGEMRLALRRWIRNDLYWDDTNVDPICRGTIVLLFDIATAMLPAEVAVGMSCMGNNTIVPSILSRARFLLNSTSSMDVKNRSEALETLRLVAGLCMKVWGNYGRAEECYVLLKSIETERGEMT